MNCVICKLGETAPGQTTVTLERGGLTLVVKNVPAEVCGNCGEAYVSETVTTQILEEAEQMAVAGALVDVRQFTPVKLYVVHGQVEGGGPSGVGLGGLPLLCHSSKVEIRPNALTAMSSALCWVKSIFSCRMGCCQGCQM